MKPLVSVSRTAPNPSRDRLRVTVRTVAEPSAADTVAATS